MTAANSTEYARIRILALIDSEYKNDSSFERAMELSPKTVSNWRRERSASFMTMLPELAQAFGVTVGYLIGIPMSKDAPDLSEEEWHLVHLYRKARTLPKPMRISLAETLSQVVTLYLTSHPDETKK